MVVLINTSGGKIPALSCCLMTENTFHHVYIGLGTNLGDRLANLQAAVQALSPSVEVLRCSSIYETPPWGVLDQPTFLNQVLFGQTGLAPVELLAFLKEQEVLLGRKTSFRYGPRLIDMDILFYDDLVLELPRLNIPHPQIPQRGFVLIPLAEIASDHVHPVSGLTSVQMMQHWMENHDGSQISIFDETKGACHMSGEELKPLNWKPQPGLGYSVSRRPDGGMNFVFTKVDLPTLKHWRDFVEEHLMDSDRLTRNLYDLRQVSDLPQRAIDVALEAVNDPSMRNIRLAVVVSNEVVHKSVEQISALGSAPGGVELSIFFDIGLAEAWLNRPLTLVV